ncbi:hypothetical protein [Pseudalkalibacillus hwajinpoensis]|uniref:hypothetical protein n=1 Tax=Guptibacillus hwajinpoensis TaxID=208199 RepID=UPI001CFEA8FF|nr:hypothetical protein [Pseudalkalibacillus hwajinpoensis]
MKDFNSLTYKEITIRYAVLTILLATTIFIVPYNLPLLVYLICMGIAITFVDVNLVKWLRGMSRRISSKGDITRTGTISFVAILLLVVPLHDSLVIRVGLIFLFLIVNVIEFIKLKKKHQLS